MRNRFLPPLPGGEHTQVFDTGDQPMPEGACAVRLVATGDGDSPTLLPVRPGRGAAPVIPTNAELHRLPRWAAVAFAARCARRVQPLAGRLGYSSSELLAQLVEGAERAASAGKTQDDLYVQYLAARNHVPREPDFHTNRSAFVAAHAALEAGRVATIYPTDVDEVVRVAVNAAEAMWYKSDYDLTFAILKNSETFHRSCRAVQRQLAMIRGDLERLERWGRRVSWQADTPVPADVFGPLWIPGHAPDWAIRVDSDKKRESRGE